MSNFGLVGFPKSTALSTEPLIKVPDLLISADKNRSPDQFAPGFLGVFGYGMYALLQRSGTYTVPNFVTRARIRVIGAGGGGASNGTGGAGGGFAIGIFDLIPGGTYNVTVPSTGGAGGISGVNSGTGVAGGAVSFGSLISATGGQGGTAPGFGPVPGTGTGGIIQSAGGSAGNIAGSGGGGAGSQLGNGGIAFYTGGAGIVQDNYGVLSMGPFGAECAYFGSTASYTGVRNPANLIVRFPFDGFLGGIFGTVCGSGMGGGENLAGGVGGGGGGTLTDAPPGVGYFGGGGGGTNSTLSGATGGAALIIIEY